MKCPYCKHAGSKVVDSRFSKDANSIRRRRECIKCEKRFTTYEQVENILPVVIKKDGRREQFDRHKILSGLRKACEKRPISMEKIEKIVNYIEKNIQNKFTREVPSSYIGELVMKKLYELDEVAYVRFASVYRQFKDINQFMSEIKKLI